jgi:hypothetical protein
VPAFFDVQVNLLRKLRFFITELYGIVGKTDQTVQCCQDITIGLNGSQEILQFIQQGFENGKFEGQDFIFCPGYFFLVFF